MLSQRNINSSARSQGARSSQLSPSTRQDVIDRGRHGIFCLEDRFSSAARKDLMKNNHNLKNAALGAFVGAAAALCVAAATDKGPTIWQYRIIAPPPSQLNNVGL